MRASAQERQVELGGKTVCFRVVSSPTALKLRVRVGWRGVEVVQPVGRASEEASEFLRTNQAWVLNQLRRVEAFQKVHLPPARKTGEILWRGERTSVQVKARKRSGIEVVQQNGRLTIRSHATDSGVVRAFERWLRGEARREITKQLKPVLDRIRRVPGKVYIMGQRTKWGNCSARRNLSFNWRLILAPEFVLRYLITHEAVHLAVPDHSPRFWLTVQSLCPETERAKQWLAAHGEKLFVDLTAALGL